MKRMIFLLACCFLLPSSVFAQDNSFTNQAMGVSISGPEGWHMSEGEGLKKMINRSAEFATQVEPIQEMIKATGPLVNFSKYPLATPVEYNPSLGVTTEDISQLPIPINSALDYLNASMNTMRIMLRDFKIIEQPKEVILNGTLGAKALIEGTIVIGYLEIRIKQAVYVFLKDSLIYGVSFSDKADNFSSNWKVAKKSIESFKLQ